MRSVSLVILMAAVAGGAWFVASGEERSTNGQATDTAQPAPAKADKREGSVSGDVPAKDDNLKELLSGKVVLLADALKERGIKSYGEEIQGQVVLVTKEDELVPIVADWRGRAFYQDERLRNRPVDLVVHRHKGVPWVQVLSIYTFDEQGARNITDYWCDICSIPMYEIKECECCQGPIRLRFRPQELPKDLVRHGGKPATSRVEPK